MAVYRIGSVGLGGISGGVHIPGIRASSDLKLTALCDINPDRLRERAAAAAISKWTLFGVEMSTASTSGQAIRSR